MARARRGRALACVLVAFALAAGVLVVEPPDPAAALPDLALVDADRISRPWDIDSTSVATSHHGNVSADGLVVAFVSDAPDLTRDVLAPVPRLHLHDRVQGTRVIDPDGTAVVDPAEPVVSRDGSVVAFTARADRSDPSGGRTVYAVDVTTGNVARVETDPDLVADAPSISDDGSTVAYAAAPVGNPAASQIRTWDRTTRATTVVSRSGGSVGNGPSTRPAISGDGTTIAFTTAATNLVAGLAPGDHRSGGTEVVVLDRASGTIGLVSALAGTGGVAPVGDSRVDGPDAVSTDGRWVAYTTAAPGTGFDPSLAEDANAGTDVVLRDRATSTARVVSRVGDATCDGASVQGAVADDGTVLFAGTCTDLTGTTLPTGSDVWAAPPGGGAVELVSHLPETAEPGRDAQTGIARPSISAAGETLAFTSTVALQATWQSPPDENGLPDVFVVSDELAWPAEGAVEVPARTVAEACPSPTRSIVADFPAPADWPTDDDPRVELVDPTLGIALALRIHPEGWATEPIDGVESDLVRAVAMELDDGAGGSRYVVWDRGIRLFGEGQGPTAEPGVPLEPRRVALCAPATYARGPQAFADTAQALVGATVEVDVLANDEGDLDLGTLAVGTPSQGTATVVTSGGRPRVRFTAPSTAGPVTVPYTVADHGGSPTGGVLTVAVGAIEVRPLDLTLTSPPIAPDASTSVALDATNRTGATVTGGVVTVVATEPATLVAAGGTGWSCSVAGGGRSATCTSAAEVADGAAFPGIDLTVRTPAGPQQPCDPADPGGGACVVLRAWNGPSDAEATATPTPVRATLAYGGGVLRASVTDDGPFVTGNLGTYQLTVANAGAAPLPAGTLVEVRAAQPDTAYAGASGGGWTCTADPTDTTRVTCAAQAPIAPAAFSTLSVLFTVGAGQPDGCPVGVVAPCALLDVAWIDTPAAGLRVPVAAHATAVEAVGNPTPPDLTVQLTHPSVVWSGQSTAFRAVVTNAGLGPTTGPVTVTVDLPAGLTATASSAQGWTCTVGTPTTTCQRPDPLAAGAIAPTVVVLADVAVDATDGVATASVGTPGDASPANNTSTDLVSVRNGDPSAADGPARLALTVDVPDTISVGATVAMRAAMINDGDEAATEPITIGLLVPDGMPVGQVLRAVPDPEGPAAWACVETPLAGVTELRCTHTGTVEPGARTPALALDLTAVAVTPGATVDLVLTHLVDGSPVSMVRRLTVVPPRVTALAVSASQPLALHPGGTAALELRGRNVGTAAPVADLRAELALPAGVVAESVGGNGWTCASLGTAAPSCTNPERPVPGTSLPPMVVVLSAAEDATAGRRDATFRFSTADAIAERTTEGTTTVSVAPVGAGDLEVVRRGIPRATDEDRSIAYDLVVANAGTVRAQGDLVVRETFPTGTAATGSGPGWTCERSGTSLLCERPGTDLASLDEAPPLRVEATFPVGLVGGQAQLSATASLGWATGLAADAVVVARVEVPAPDVGLAITGQPSQLVRGATGTAVVRVANDGDADATDPVVVGVVLSRGLVPTGVAAAGWTCVHDGSAARAVAACRRDAGPAAGATLPAIEVAFDVSTGTGDQAVLAAGTLTGVEGTDLAPVVTRLQGQGTAALVEPVEDVRPVRGLHAEAGPDQSVPERTPVAGGATVATAVRLDGRGSSAGSAPLAWQWVQTAGPPVAWHQVAGTVAAADGTERPYATGANPQFDVPRLAEETGVDLVFELTAASGDATATDVVTVSVTPTGDLGPALARITTNLDQIVTAPPDGTDVELRTTATDPEGDAVSMSWAIAATDGSLASATIAVGSNLVTEPGGGSTATFDWPAGATYVVVEATGVSARGGTSVTSLAIGSAPPPPSISATGPARVASGAPVTLTASVDVGDPSTLLWRWRQTSGPAIDPAVLNAANGPELTFTAPSVSTEGQVVELTAVATRVAGASSVAAPATVTVAVDPLPAPAVGIEGDAAVAVDAPADLRLTGVPPGSSVTWAQRSGPAGGFSSTTAATTTFRAVADGVAAVEARVVDPTGRATSATFEITVGTPFAPSGSTACTTAGSFINEALAAAGEGRALAATIGPASVDLGRLEVQAPCGGTAPSLTFVDAGFSVAGGTVTGTGLAGRITPDRLCLTGGALAFPSSWGLSSVALGTASPICVALAAGAPNPVTGSLTLTGLPLLKLPAGVASPVTTVDFSGAALRVAATAGLPDGGGITLGLDVDLGTGAFSGTASGRVVVLGTAVDFSGGLAYDGTAFTFSLSGSVPGPITLVPGTTLSALELHLDRDGIRFGGQVSVEGRVSLQATGSFSAVDRWSLALTGTAGQADWQPLPGLTLGPAGFAGRVARDGGPIAFDVRVSVPTAWSPVSGLTVTGVTATLANVQAPAECPSVPTGTVWLAATGLAEVALGATSIDLDVQACVAPTRSAWSLASTATLDSWQPIAGVDVSLESVGVRALDQGTGAGVVLTAHGMARAFGASLGAVVTYQGGSLVVDASGDLSQFPVPLPEGASGHAVFASGPRNGYRFHRPGAIPTIDPNLAAVNIPSGVSLYAAMDLPRDLRDFMVDQLHLPDVSSVVVSVQVGGAPVLEATVNFGDAGFGSTVYEDCGGTTCTTDTRTRLSMTGLTLQIGVDSFGFRAAGKLELPATDQTAASEVALRVGMTIDFAGPKLTMFFETDGVWHGALGTPGLDLSRFVVQGGLTFGTGIPTPELGVLATVDRLPDDWAATIGMDPANPEPITLGINLAVTAPIVDIQIGVDDGNTAIDPLAPMGAPDVLRIDYASLVVAPFGGTIGTRTYAPGISLGFAATIGGVEVDAGFSVNVTTMRIQGDVAVGTISLGGLTVHGVHGTFDINPSSATTKFEMALAGGVRIDQFGLGGAFVDAAFAVRLGGTGLAGELEVTAGNIDLGGVARIDDFRLHAAVDVGAGRLPDVAMQVEGRGALFGVEAGIAGSFAFSGGRLTELAAALSLNATLGPVSLTGPGCTGYDQLGPGACVQFAMAGPAVQAELAARLEVGGFALQVDGRVNRALVQASGLLEVPGVGSFSVSGTIYHGDAAALAGYSEVDLAGVSRQVQRGDLRLASAFTTAAIGGFGGSASMHLVRVGPSFGLRSQLWVTVPGGYVDGFGEFTKAGTETTFDFALTGRLDVGVRLDPVSVRFTKTPTSFSAAASATVALALPGVSGVISVSGSFAKAPGSAATFDLSGAAAISLAGVGVDATFHLSSQGGFRFSANLGAATVFDATVAGSFNGHGHVHAYASVDVVGIATTISVKRTTADWSVTATLSYQGYTFADARIGPGTFSASVSFAKTGSGSLNLGLVRVGGSFSMSMSFGITIARSGGGLSLGARFAGSGHASGWIQGYECSGFGCIIGEGWHWGPQRSLGSVGAWVNTETGNACAEIYGETLCI